MWNVLYRLEHDMGGIGMVSSVSSTVEELLQIFIKERFTCGETARNAALDAVIAILQAEKTPDNTNVTH